MNSTHTLTPIIRFSHIYPKLLDRHHDLITTATLLTVITLDLADQHPSFLAYDTEHGEDQHFPLPSSGTYLLLVFLKPHDEKPTDLNLFTTLRRWTRDKEHYYRAQRGHLFIVAVWRKSRSQPQGSTKA